MSDASVDLFRIGVPMCYTIAVIFGVFGVYLAYYSYNAKNADHSISYYLTARNTQPMLLVIWGLFGTAVGAGVINNPAAFITDYHTGAGYLGMVAMCVFTGLPLLLAGILGPTFRSKLPQATSIAAFAKWRFGAEFGILVTIVSLITMATTLATELQSLSNMYIQVLGLPFEKRSGPIICAGTIPLLYILMNGLSASMSSVQFQSLFAMLIFMLTLLYLGAVFRPGDMDVIPAYLDTTAKGQASFISLGSQLTSSAMFSDAMWQLVWSAQSDATIRISSSVACILASSVTFIFSIFSFLAGWLGLVTHSWDATSSTSNSGIAFFQALRMATPKNDPQFTPVGPAWLATLICMAGTALNASFVSAYQVGLVNTITSVVLVRGFCPSTHLARFILLAVNIPIIVASVALIDVAAWACCARLIATCFLAPTLMGMLESLDKIATGASAIFGVLSSLLCVFIYAWTKVTEKKELSSSAYDVFFHSKTVWQPHAIALIVSAVGMLLYALVDIGVRSMYGWTLPDAPKPEESPAEDKKPE
ncbi:hypothetical protein BDV3_003557 [Batrachochytrium dendrobatidis]|uniref:Uncharacterized protein n=1 Tax=Batrachochytrium dendrobatidis (strain JEL423) TaxID=403673 RepID=A0A177WE52_BATDL|nr:hypothetical protein QVD99_003820 [Batrachochytrium dendrobatidis]OAJ37954.1 hypothetical protein BDEG_21923 [Batrachochytrium dendrobatidis JEL423]